MADKIIVCEVCDRALNRYADADGVSYLHSAPDCDHLPVPVEACPGWRGQCDFCSAEKAGFVLPARDFRVPYFDNQMSVGDWAACTVCALLIESNRWNEVERRTINAQEKLLGCSLPDSALTAVRALHRALRKAITGSIRAIDEA